MTVPHVTALSPGRTSDAPTLPEVTTVSGLKRLLDSTTVEETCLWIDAHWSCDCAMCSIFGVNIWSVESRALAYAYMFRCWLSDRPQNAREVPGPFGAHILRHLLGDNPEAYRAPSHVDRPLPDAAQLLDATGQWLGLPDLRDTNLEYGYVVFPSIDNPLFEYVRGSLQLAQARAAGERSRRLSQMRQMVDPLEPAAVAYARQMLIDPINAAIAALEQGKAQICQ